MGETKLDRLSALLDGLAPVVTLSLSPDEHDSTAPLPDSANALQIYFLTCGSASLEFAGSTQKVESPALIAVQANDTALIHRFSTDDPHRLVSARVLLTGPVAHLFLEEFKEPRTLALDHAEPALGLAVAMIESELNVPRCGQPALLNRAGDILFIGLLRHLVAHPTALGAGLFNGLADPRIAKALVAMHQRPAFAWDLELLAQEAGMSRTAFATKFHQIMRRPPGKYLAAIRLAIAQRAVDIGKGLKEAAKLAGYESTSALSRALTKSKLYQPTL